MYWFPRKAETIPSSERRNVGSSCPFGEAGGTMGNSVLARDIRGRDPDMILFLQDLQQRKAFLSSVQEFTSRLEFVSPGEFQLTARSKIYLPFSTNPCFWVKKGQPALKLHRGRVGWDSWSANFRASFLSRRCHKTVA